MRWIIAVLGFVLLAHPEFSVAATTLPSLFQIGKSAELSPVLSTFLFLTALSAIPAMMIAVTAFTRIIIVFSMLRHALGMQQTPPNSVLITLAFFLTLFTMNPVIQEIKTTAYDPYQKGTLTEQAALETGFKPLRAFMIRQTHEEDLLAILDIAKASRPKTAEDISTLHLIPAFMLSELKSAFQIAFVIFLPFLLIDLVVSSILMALGMVMVPPTTLSLPLKVLLFVLIDGWALVTTTLVGSFH